MDPLLVVRSQPAPILLLNATFRENEEPARVF